MKKTTKRQRSDSPTSRPCPFSYIDPSTISAVSRACMRGAESELTRLISSGASTDTLDNQGRTALHFAAAQGNLGCCRVLIDTPGIDLNSFTHDGVTPIMLAVEGGHTEVAVLLHSKGAKADQISQGLSCLDRAVKKGNMPLFKLLLTDLEVSPNLYSFQGWSIAHSLAKSGHTDFLTELISHPEYHFKATDFGITPLHLAAQEGHLPCARLLVDRYSYSVDRKADDGVTALFLAAQNKHPAIVEFLLERGSSVLLVTDNGTVLHSAVLGGHTGCLTLLLEAGADVEGAIGRTEVDTPLSQAVFNNSLPCVRILLSHGADPLMCSTDPYSCTPLSICFENLTTAGIDDDSCLVLQSLLSAMSREVAVTAVSSELAKTFQDSDCLELLETLVKLMPRWSLSEVVPPRTLKSMVEHGRMRCLAYLIRSNYTFSRDGVFPLTLQYVVSSTAGVEHKHLLHQALVDQVPSFHQTQLFMLRNKSHPVTMNPPKAELLARISSKATSPPGLVELCRYRLRSLLPCSPSTPDTVASLPLTDICKEILMYERRSMVAPSQLTDLKRSASPTPGEIRQFLVM